MTRVGSNDGDVVGATVGSLVMSDGTSIHNGMDVSKKYVCTPKRRISALSRAIDQVILVTLAASTLLLVVLAAVSLAVSSGETAAVLTTNSSLVDKLQRVICAKDF
jgi:hypothetical protein